MRLSQPKPLVSEREQCKPLMCSQLLSWVLSRPLRLTFCLILTYLAEPIVESLIEPIVGEHLEGTSALKVAEAKKRKKKRRKKKKMSRHKSHGKLSHNLKFNLKLLN